MGPGISPSVMKGDPSGTSAGQGGQGGAGGESGLRESPSSRREAGYGCGGFAEGVGHPNAESVLAGGSMQVLAQFLKGSLLNSRFDSVALTGFRCRCPELLCPANVHRLPNARQVRRMTRTWWARKMRITTAQLRVGALSKNSAAGFPSKPCCLR
jgi:hypothetical protein